VDGSYRIFILHISPVYHERLLSTLFKVRVPMNTIRLGLDSINHQMMQADRDGNAEGRATAAVDGDTTFVLSCMDEAVGTMSDTLNDVLSYQKIEEGRVEVSLCPFEVVPMLQQVAFGLEAAAKEKHLELQLEIDQATPRWVVGDAMKIRQVGV
jgi:signal transduction histidine kinase